MKQLCLRSTTGAALLSAIAVTALTALVQPTVASDVEATDLAQVETPGATPSSSTETELSEIEMLLEKVNMSEQLYNEAFAAFEAGSYRTAESMLRQVIAGLVDPEFPQTDGSSQAGNSEADEICKDAPAWLQGICRVTFGVTIFVAEHVAVPIARATEQLFFGESSIEWDFEDEEVRRQLEENAERAHRVASNSLRLLQRVLITQSDGADHKTALEIAELSREFEYVRLTPLLQARDRLAEPAIPNQMDIAQIEAIAKAQKSAIVYYSVVDPNEMYVWIISPRGETRFKSVPVAAGTNTIAAQAEITRRAAAAYIDRGEAGTGVIVWSRGLRSSEPEAASQVLVTTEDEQTAQLKSLYRVMIAPIDEFLPAPNPDPANPTHVIFIPQGPLFAVPFAALLDDLDQSLIDKYTVRIAPNLRTLSHSSKTLNEFPQGENILFVGNPIMPRVQLAENESPKQLPSLRGAETETKVIANLFQSNPLVRDVATETEVRQKMGSASVIHLATHGILDNRNLALTNADLGKIIEDEYGEEARTTNYFSKLVDDLLPGAIALTQSNEEDGLLTARELLGLDLNAELVVLSACNTARGISGESTILGLPFSLGAAGAERVVVSLWAVPDKPTQELMRLYYLEMRRQSLYEEAIDPTGALRHAMLEIKQQEDYRDPVNWAGFTLIEVKQSE